MCIIKGISYIAATITLLPTVDLIRRTLKISVMLNDQSKFRLSAIADIEHR